MWRSSRTKLQVRGPQRTYGAQIMGDRSLIDQRRIALLQMTKGGPAMTHKKMLKTPVPKRRGAVTNESGGYDYLLVREEPEKILDALISSGVIGAARRTCLEDVTAGNVLRPLGRWGALVRLKGHPFTYVLGDGLSSEWPKKWAEQYGWRVAWFSLDDVGTKVARLYDGPRELFNFACGMADEAEPGFHFRKELDDDSAMIRGEAEVCSK